MATKATIFGEVNIFEELAGLIDTAWCLGLMSQTEAIPCPHFRYRDTINASSLPQAPSIMAAKATGNTFRVLAEHV